MFLWIARNRCRDANTKGIAFSWGINSFGYHSECGKEYTTPDFHFISKEKAHLVKKDLGGDTQWASSHLKGKIWIPDPGPWETFFPELTLKPGEGPVKFEIRRV